MIDFVMVVILGLSIGILLLFFWEQKSGRSDKGREMDLPAFDPVTKRKERIGKGLQETEGIASEISVREDFEQLYDEEYAKGIENQQPFSLILIEVDYLQEVVESEGLLAGDQIFQHVIQMIRFTLKRNRDHIARYGSNEIIIVLPNTGVGGALFIAEQIRSNIESLKIPHGKSKVSRYVTVSVGVASLDRVQHITPSELRIGVEKALYYAKQEGRNRIFLYQSSQNLKI